MKRSDMIAALAGYLMDYKTFTGTQFNARDLSEYVLDCALRKGMLPPPDSAEAVTDNIVYTYYDDRVIEDEDGRPIIEKLWESEE